jgi:hypothetical protein
MSRSRANPADGGQTIGGAVCLFISTVKRLELAQNRTLLTELFPAERPQPIPCNQSRPGPS